MKRAECVCTCVWVGCVRQSASWRNLLEAHQLNAHINKSVLKSHNVRKTYRAINNKAVPWGNKSRMRNSENTETLLAEYRWSSFSSFDPAVCFHVDVCVFWSFSFAPHKHKLISFHVSDCNLPHLHTHAHWVCTDGSALSPVSQTKARHCV